MSEKVCNGCNSHKEDESFALTLLKDYKKQCRNWFIAFLVVVVLWFSTIGMFVWFLGNSEIETYTIEQSTENGGNANYIGANGDIINGISESDDTANI